MERNPICWSVYQMVICSVQQLSFTSQGAYTFTLVVRSAVKSECKFCGEVQTNEQKLPLHWLTERRGRSEFHHQGCPSLETLDLLFPS